MKYTLWTLLHEQNIEVPIFQRDYAQGRPDKAILRRDFLSQLICALTRTDSNKYQGSLDFVYSFGESPNESHPLDGQQRLTTLWLLHWYVAVHALEEAELADALDILRRFSYATRHSSSDFIKALCEAKNVKTLANSKSISDDIKDSTWFAKTWLHDPTVLGLLTTLAGTEVQNDGIQPLLGCDKALLLDIWSCLTAEDCPISFDHLNIESIEVKAPDLLYVKMNARGKSLSAYEKFKAQWVKSIKDHDKDEAFEFSKLIDTKWSELFWDKNLNTKGIDQRKMAFYTRFFLCRLFDIINKAFSSKEQGGKLLARSTVYAKENTKEGYDFRFDGLEDYTLTGLPGSKDGGPTSQSLLDSSTLQQLKTLFQRLTDVITWDNFSDLIPDYGSHFSFIPVLREDEKKDDDGNYYVKSISMKEQVMFYSLASYLINSENPNPESFERWMRVCCNIAENTNLNSETSTHLTVISKISEFASHDCDDIYTTLISVIPDDFIPKSQLDQVLLEERQKAAQILNDPDIEKTIEDAETFAFFRGAIRFLYLDAEGNPDWSQFNHKFATAQQLFCSKGLTEAAKSKDDANRKLISHCDNWDSQIQNKIHILSHSADTWRPILLNRIYREPVHKLIATNQFAPSPKLNDNDLYRQESHQILISGSYLNTIKDSSRNDLYINWCDDGMCIYFPYRKSESYFLSSDRLPIMRALSDMFHESGEIDVSGPSNGKFYSRADTFAIKYRGHEFRVQHWGYTDMYHDSQRLENIPAIRTSDINPHNHTAEEIKKALDACIARYEAESAALP